MRNRITTALRLLILALGVASTASRAQEVALLAPVKDNTLYEDPTGSLSNGAGEYFFGGKTASKGPNNPVEIRRGLIQFDPATALPAGSTITAVTLTLTVSRVPQADTFDMSLHRVVSDWGEGSSDADDEEGDGAASSTGDATWIHTFYDTSFWASVGGDYIGTASASQSVGDVGSYLWSSPTMVSEVQGWLDGSVPNHGWILIGDESTDRTVKRFNSREHSTTSTRPVLAVTYTPPAGTAACCDGSGGCTVTTELACTGTWLEEVDSCSPSPCQGACCLADGSCTDDQTLTECTTAAGTYQGDESLCSEVSCPVLTGACCVPGTPGSCSVVSTAACTGLGGTFQGVDTSCQVDLCPFVDPLPIPATAVPTSGTPGGTASYDIAMTEFTQQLHRDLPPTTVWGYGGSYPGPNIEARSGQPVTVTWKNDLRVNGVLRSEHYLPVDTCMHGPDTEGSAPRTVVHLHGGHVPPEVDGYPEDTFLPGEEVTYVYPNNQEAATLWFHDHALGITRLNVYMGLAGLYTLRDDVEDALGLPSGEYEIPLVIQDRAFNPDGSLSYPATWQGHFFGDTILVNGKVWPYLDVEKGKYRFRVLNGSNSRVYTLTFDDGAPPGAAFSQIGSEGGLLPAPVSGLTELTISPGERADLVVDFAGYPTGTEIVLTNSAVAPYPSGAAGSVVADVMKFIVVDEPGDTDALPGSLRSLEILDEADSLRERELVLTKELEECAGSWWVINGLGWNDITEKPVLGTTEVWSFINQTGVVHPMHMHLVFFQLLDRQPFELVEGEIVPQGEPVLPNPEEAGWKDTVQAPPNEITRVIARFDDYTGLFPYHCHILEHEDHEMMRQFEVLGGTITVAKETRPPGQTQLFTVTGDVAGSLSDGESISATPLAPGTYTATEQVPSNWELTSIACDDVDSSGNAAAATATFALSVADIEARSAPTSTITCTFSNCILDLVLSGEAVSGIRTYEACDTITASDFSVEADAGSTDVTFVARSAVILGSAFTVEEGAELTVSIDPGL
jgi:spore coat protein A